MARTWTESQKDAIFTQGNLIVSAAAGSGKTSVLTERLCELVSSGVPVERILVLTFTRAAASEMKQRILNRIREEVNTTADDKKRAFLLAELSAVNTANISTIDSFCTRILRRHGHTIGLDSSMRIMDTVESSVLAQSVMDDMLRDLAENDDADLHILLNAFRSEEAVTECITSVNTFLNARPFPELWMDRALERFSDPDVISAALDDILEDQKLKIQNAVDTFSRERRKINPEDVKNIGMLDYEVTACKGFSIITEYDKYREALESIQFDRLNFSKDVPDAVKEPLKNARDKLKDAIKKQKQNMLHTKEEEQAILLCALPVAESLFRLVRTYRDLYASAKIKKGVLDYTDLEHFSLKLLEDERISAEYREKFQYICIDEYQDSNGVQEELINRIRRNDNLFLVGDVKQSIYRFRAAEPELFLEKLETYTGRTGRRIDLNANFRSTQEVIDAVNTVFSAIMSKDVGEMEYDDTAKLYKGSEIINGKAELHLISRTAEDDSQDEEDDTKPKRTDRDIEELNDMSDAEAEAVFMAGKIRELMADPENHLKYSDIAILLRNTAQAQTISETLAVFGIPCYAQSSGGYFDAIEVMVLLNCLRVIDNQQQDIPLLSVLRSPLFRFTTDELSRIRILRPDRPFYDAFFHFAGVMAKEPENDALFQKVSKTQQFLDKLRYESTLLSVTDLLLKIIDETCYYELMGALPAGAQRQRNIDALIEKARVFESTGSRGIWRFLKTMDAASNNATIGAAQASAGNVVRIFTIHKSKGLEFPVVFVAQLGHRFNRTDSTRLCVMHNNLGLGLRYTSDELRYDTALYRAIQYRQRMESTAEEMRVLYVAMTRAKQCLYLVGSCDPGKYVLPSVPVSKQYVADALCPIPWLLAGTSADRKALPVFRHDRTEFLAEVPDQQKPDLSAAKGFDMYALLKAFTFEYSHADAISLPAKQSVSGVVHKADEQEILEHMSFDPPAFVSGNRLTSAQKGTIVHRILEHLPKKHLDPPEFTAFVNNLCGRLTDAESLAKVLKETDFSWFTESDLWKRAIQSSQLERERNFSDLVPARELFDTDSAEPIILQGTIDCCFVENGKWVLIDYKTDHLKKGETFESHAETHRNQLELYASALKHLTGIDVSELYVVFLSLKQIVKL